MYKIVLAMPILRIQVYPKGVFSSIMGYRYKKEKKLYEALEKTLVETERKEAVGYKTGWETLRETDLSEVDQWECI